MVFAGRDIRKTDRSLGALVAVIIALLAAGSSYAQAGSPLGVLEQVEDHYMLGEYTKALYLLERSAAADPDMFAASREHQIWLARCLIQLGRDTEAVDVFCRVRDLDRAWRPDPEFVPEGEREVFYRSAEECRRASTRLSAETEPAPISPSAFPEKTGVTRGGAVTRSVLLPGLGQIAKGQPTRGRVFMGAATVTLGLAVAGQLQRSSRLDAYDRAREDYLAAVTLEDINRTYAEYQDKADHVHSAENLRDIGLYAFIGVYVANVIDAALGFPLGEGAVKVSAESPTPDQARLVFAVGLP